MSLLKYALVILFIFTGCSSGFLKYDKAEDLSKNTEFETKVQIKEVVAEASPAVQVVAPPEKPSVKKPAVLSKKKNVKAPAEPVVRQPDLEDREGFNQASRRPIVDPFRVGEKVVHEVSYFGKEAGQLSFSVKPFVEVNGKKSYNFVTDIQTTGLFSSIYSVDDQVETYVDYQQLVPHVFKLKIKESGQLKEARSYFDQQTLKANYWEKKYTEKNGHEEKKLDWDLLPFSQNAFSSVYYMRVFKWNIGQEYAFRVSDDGKNIVFKAKALEKVKLDTDAGKFDAIKIKAEIVSRGVLTQTGDLYLWISDDEHKYVLRIEAKIKIGTIVSEIISLTP